MWRKLAVHKHLLHCSITESVDTETESATHTDRRYTATIYGYRNWKLGNDWKQACERAKIIRAKIEQGDESVFSEAMP